MLNLRVNTQVEFKSAWEWIKSAFYIFREQPVQFIILSLLLVLFGLVPLLGIFMAPLFVGHFARLTEKVENGEKIQFSNLFNDFFSNMTLIRLAFINFSLNTILLIAKYFLEMHFSSNVEYAELSHTVINMGLLLIQVLIGFTMWISPVICLNYPEIRPVTAMGMSIKVGLYNILTLLTYSMLVLVFTILAILPVGLGLLIWVPVMNISIYYIYKSTIQKV